jgi:hypothetical protein
MEATVTRRLPSLSVSNAATALMRRRPRGDGLKRELGGRRDRGVAEEDVLTSFRREAVHRLMLEVGEQRAGEVAEDAERLPDRGQPTLLTL